MIKLKTLSWSNAFSYGEDVSSIDFSANKLVQLIGKNGEGKTSIALILEEVLFNKNSKGIKKGGILNRFTKGKKYYISLEFEKNGDEYFIESIRTTTQKVTLIKNNIDISGHTATSTYKLIEEIIGIEHKAFAQLVYQSHSSSLEFLKSADTARKKFLIDLLNLNRYTEIGIYFKNLTSEISKELVAVTSKCDTIKDWLAKHNSKDLEIKVLVPVPEIDDSIQAKINVLSKNKDNIVEKNLEISNNISYKNIIDSLSNTYFNAAPPSVLDTGELISLKANASKSIKDAEQVIANIKKLNTSCPTCNSVLTTQEDIASMLATQKDIVAKYTPIVLDITATLLKVKEETTAWNLALSSKQELEKYTALYDPTLPTTILSRDSLIEQINSLEDTLLSQTRANTKALEENVEITAHNTRVELILTQLVLMEKDLKDTVALCDSAAHKKYLLDTLSKTFSTTGLVAYKIESLIIDLENVSNTYLGELSDGRFQISFQMSDNDKLNVVIIDNGNNIDIQALSAGEMARVNVSVLLAIRSITNSLYSEAQINLLFLDETISTLDADGKERLVEVLLNEKMLNTVLVSHDYAHPLIDKIQVVKVDNISSIIKE